MANSTGRKNMAQMHKMPELKAQRNRDVIRPSMWADVGSNLEVLYMSGCTEWLRCLQLRIHLSQMSQDPTKASTIAFYGATHSVQPTKPLSSICLLSLSSSVESDLWKGHCPFLQKQLKHHGVRYKAEVQDASAPNLGMPRGIHRSLVDNDYRTVTVPVTGSLLHRSPYNFKI